MMVTIIFFACWKIGRREKDKAIVLFETDYKNLLPALKPMLNNKLKNAQITIKPIMELLSHTETTVHKEERRIDKIH